MSEFSEIREFQQSLLSNGIVGYSYDDLSYLLNAAKICARTAGIPMAGAGAVMGAAAGSVTIPGVGAIPGWVAGALAGFAGGTLTCTIARAGMKPALDEILRNR